MRTFEQVRKARENEIIAEKSAKDNAKFAANERRKATLEYWTQAARVYFSDLYEIAPEECQYISLLERDLPVPQADRSGPSEFLTCNLELPEHHEITFSLGVIAGDELVWLGTNGFSIYGVATGKVVTELGEALRIAHGAYLKSKPMLDAVNEVMGGFFPGGFPLKKEEPAPRQDAPEDLDKPPEKSPVPLYWIIQRRPCMTCQGEGGFEITSCVVCNARVDAGEIDPIEPLPCGHDFEQLFEQRIECKACNGTGEIESTVDLHEVFDEIGVVYAKGNGSFVEGRRPRTGFKPVLR